MISEKATKFKKKSHNYTFDDCTTTITDVKKLGHFFRICGLISKYQPYYQKLSPALNCEKRFEILGWESFIRLKSRLLKRPPWTCDE